MLHLCVRTYLFPRFPGIFLAYCNSVQEKAFDDAVQLFNAVMWYHGENSNTLKNGKNPETF